MRVGIMSFAHVHAEGFVGNLRAAPGVELVGFSDDDAARGARFAEAFGLRHLAPCLSGKARQKAPGATEFDRKGFAADAQTLLQQVGKIVGFVLKRFWINHGCAPDAHGSARRVGPQ